MAFGFMADVKRIPCMAVWMAFTILIPIRGMGMPAIPKQEPDTGHKISTF